MKVEIWSDVVCPWCYLGKRRFEHALAQFEHKDSVEVSWRSFQLDPSVPRGLDEPVMGWLTKKLRMPEARVRMMNEHLRELAAAEGLDMKLDTCRTAHTLDAHRMLHLLRKHGVRDPEERFFRAQFTDNRAMGQGDTLVSLAVELGVPEAEARDVIASSAFADQVVAEIEEGRRLGISGVPCFVVDRHFAVSGAQETDVFLDALREGWQRTAA
jgi:predicted DsbA family dithiol-disulfide isomerase